MNPIHRSVGQRNGIGILLFWSRFTFRHVRSEWLQTTLLLLILGLGVGTFLSIRMANRAAVEGFRLFTDSLNGTSDWILEAEGPGIEVTDLPAIREALDGIPASLFPVLEVSLYPLLEEGPPETANPDPVRVLGLDLVQIQALSGDEATESPEAFWEMLDTPDHLMISRATAEAWGTNVGKKVMTAIQGRQEIFEISALLPEFNGKTPLPQNLAVADIRSLLKRLGQNSVTRVEVVIPQGTLRESYVEEAGLRLQESFGERWVISSPRDKQVDGETMTEALRLNLSVLSLVALLVGIFLIAQTLDATVSRRRTEIATLRSLGIGPRQIYRLWLSEAVLYGILAGVLGLLVGYGLTFFTVEAVTTTVRALYRETSQTAASLTGMDVILSFSLGIGGSLVAAWLPARDAASTPPAQFLRMGKRIPPFPIFEHPKIGIGMIVTGAVLAFLPAWPREGGMGIPVAGYASAFLWLTGGTLIAAGSLKGIGKIMQKAGGNHAPARLAGSRLRQPTSRHQLALSGFFVAIGMASAMAFLINSFEHTVTGWLEHRLRADLFISSSGFQGADSGPRMDGTLLDQIETLPGVRAIDRYRSQQARINGTPFTLAGIRFDLLGTEQDLLWLDGPSPDSEAPTGVDATGFANENFMRRTGIEKGQELTLGTPGGNKVIRIEGIHADYARDNGLLLIDLAMMKEWYRIHDYETASVFLDDSVDVTTLQSRIRETYPGLTVRQNGELMKAALFIFNQTFAVTRALQVIGLVVALAGLGLSLMSLLRESGKELSLQKTLGMSRHEIATTTALEGLGVALTGLISGLVLSVTLGFLLIYVINRQSFGWTLQAAYPLMDGVILALGVLGLGSLIAYATGRLYLRKWKQGPS